MINLITQNEALLLKNLHKFFLIRLIRLGFNLFGRNIIKMGDYLAI